MIISIVLVVFLGIMLLDYIPGRKGRKTKENVFNATVLTISFIILLLYSLDITLPNPTKAIESIVKLITPID